MSLTSLSLFKVSAEFHRRSAG